MMFIHSRIYRVLCQRYGFKPFALLGIVVLCLVGWRLHQETDLAEKEKHLALEACGATQTEMDCTIQIEQNHQICFDQNYSTGTILAPNRFNRNEYRRCLELGSETWLAEKRAMADEQKRLQRLAYE